MEILASFVIIVAFIASFNPMDEIPQDEIMLYLGDKNNHQIQLRQKVIPLNTFNDINIIKQSADYSCGSAALATLLNYYLGEDLTESQVIHGMLEYGDRGLIEKRRAFSLLDMKRFVAKLGYHGAGYTAEIDDLRSLERPCIVPIEIYQYNHFVVYKGIYDGHIFFADPFMGNISFALSKFEKIWYKNVAFVVSPEDESETLDLVTLKEKDLRYVYFNKGLNIKTDRFRNIINEEKKVKEAAGRYDYFNIH